MFVKVDLKQVNELPKSIPIILVPYRDNAEQDRADHLKKFISHMARYHPDWRVLVIEQSQDERKFNRGALLNIGARIAQRMKIDHIILLFLNNPYMLVQLIKTSITEMDLLAKLYLYH